MAEQLEPRTPDPDRITTMQEFRAALDELRHGASYADLERAARPQHLSTRTVSDLLRKEKSTPKRETVTKFLVACGVTAPDMQRWIGAYERVCRYPVSGEVPARSRVREWGPIELGVGRAVHVRGVPAWLKPVPRYVARVHDRQLRDLLKKSAREPRMIVLVGGASVGKTRSAYEAIAECVPEWQLVVPTKTHEICEQLGPDSVNTETVVWLDDAELYIRDQDTAAVLYDLVTKSRRDVVVMATMWLNQWQDLRARPDSGRDDPHSHARRLLDQAVRVNVAETFGTAELAEAEQLARVDPRIEAAYKARGPHGKITQVLAGAVELNARYLDADPQVKAVLMAAMDARRLGDLELVSLSFLREAAVGYLSPEQRAKVLRRWPKECRKAVARCEKEQKGVAALTQLIIDSDKAFRLAEYLAHQGRRDRHGVAVPAQTWDAFVAHIAEVHARRNLAREAARRRLLRHACLLAIPLALDGDAASMCVLAEQYDRVDDLDRANAWWHRSADLGDPYGTCRWAQCLERDGEDGPAETQWRRAISLGSPYAVRQLTDRLDRDHRRTDEAEELWRQAVDDGDPYAIAEFVEWLKRHGRGREAEDLWESMTTTGRVPNARWVTGTVELSSLLAEAGRREEAKRMLSEAAQQGHPAAMVQLAAMLAADGQSGEAESWRTNAASMGHVPAMRDLADHYRNHARPEQAEEWFRLGVEAGDTYSMWHLADLLDRQGRATEASEMWQLAARRGDERTMVHLADRLHEAGEAEEAGALWRAAIENGHVPAVARLAKLLNGLGRDAEAQRLSRYGIEPGGRTAEPWEPDVGE